MINQTTFKFLKLFSKNNSHLWMRENKIAYNLATNNLIDFTQTLIDKVSEFDDDIASVRLEARFCVARLNRDFCFDKNKAHI